METALANNAVQIRIAEANASRIISACEDFHAASGRFPETLAELVPGYMPSIPRAKYSLAFGNFMYFNRGTPMLVWHAVPPYGRRVYNFEVRKWNLIE